MASSLLLAASCLLLHHSVPEVKTLLGGPGRTLARRVRSLNGPKAEESSRGVGRGVGTPLAVLPLALWAYPSICHLSRVLCDLRQDTASLNFRLCL